MIRFAKESIVSEGELIARYQLPTTRDTPEAVYVENLVPGSHYKVVFTESIATLGALCPEQSAGSRFDRRHAREDPVIVVIGSCKPESRGVLLQGRMMYEVTIVQF